MVIFFYTITYLLLGGFMIKNYFMYLAYTFVSILILILIVTVFNYFNLLGSSITSTLKLVIPVGSLLVNSLLLGKKAKKRGILEGLKFGGIFIFVILILNNLILMNSFEIKILIYYVILLISAMFGSMIGINLKKSDN